MAEKEKDNDEKRPGLGKDGADVKEFGQMMLEHKVHLLTVIGEIEGHECLSANTKTTKYEHVLPQLAAIEESDEIKGLLVLLNTAVRIFEGFLTYGHRFVFCYRTKRLSACIQCCGINADDLESRTRLLF